MNESRHFEFKGKSYYHDLEEWEYYVHDPVVGRSTSGHITTRNGTEYWRDEPNGENMSSAEAFELVTLHNTWVENLKGYKWKMAIAEDVLLKLEEELRIAKMRYETIRTAVDNQQRKICDMVDRHDEV